MIEINNVNNIIKMVFFNILIYIVFLKITNYRKNNENKIMIIFFISIIEEFVGLFLMKYIPRIIIMIITYFIHSIFIAKLTKHTIKYSFIITLISVMIIYIIHIISIVLVAIAINILGLNMSKDNIFILITLMPIESWIINSIFTIKRIKYGIPFLKEERKVYNIGIIGMIFIGIVLIIYSVIQDTVHTRYIFWGILIESICFAIWLRKKITKFYKEKVRDNTIEELEGEIKSKNDEISKILEENKNIAIINHKYSSRIRALENFSVKVMSNKNVLEKMQIEFGDEFANFEKQIKELSTEYTGELENKVKNSNKLPKTEIFGIDNILEYMKKECENSGIAFNLKISANVKYMIENIINQNRLETLLADHIKDAIIAINCSNNKYKSILVTIGVHNECYEICIYDTGIEFEIDTLLKLGKETVTTHKETGGSGIGYMTTFETLKETKASLIIDEKHPISDNDFTKIIKIRFDGKQEYRINSYRAEEIKCKSEDKNIIIKSNK